MTHPNYPTPPDPTPNHSNQHMSGYPQYPNYTQYSYPQATGGNGLPNAHNADFYSDPNPLEAGDGTINVMAAVRYAGRRWASNLNWLTWAGLLFAPIALLLGLIVFTLFGTQSGGTTAQVFSGLGLVISLLAVILTVLVSLWMYRGAVVQAEHPKMTFSLFFRDSHVLSQILLGIIGMIALAPIVLLLFWITGGFAPVGDDGQTSGIIVGLLAILVMPFLTLIPYFVADDRAVFDAIGDGFRAGRENWLKLFLYFLVESFVANVAISLTLGLATFVVVPLLMIIRGHMTRQFSGDPIPLGTNQ